MSSSSPKRARRASAMLAAAALVASFGGAATAADEKEPEFIEQQVFMQCDGSTKVSNANLILDGSQPTWSTDAPTESIQDGAGCGAADPSLAGSSQETLYDATWRGTYTGNLDNLQMELHMIAPHNAAYSAAFNVTLTIDGQAIAVGEDGFVESTATPSESGASYSVELAVDKLGLIDDDEGPGTAVHDIHLTVDGNYVNTGQYAWVWGTTEVPAGITFNADRLHNVVN